jgi:hypothetical protein
MITNCVDRLIWFDKIKKPELSFDFFESYIICVNQVKESISFAQIRFLLLRGSCVNQIRSIHIKSGWIRSIYICTLTSNHIKSHWFIAIQKYTNVIESHQSTSIACCHLVFGLFRGLLLSRPAKSKLVLDVWNIENAYLVWRSLGVHLDSTVLPARRGGSLFYITTMWLCEDQELVSEAIGSSYSPGEPRMLPFP